MSAKLVSLVKTPYTIPDVLKSLILAWHNVYNEFPNKESIGVIFSQWSLETGQGKACYNNNLFNVKYMNNHPELDSDDIAYFMLPHTWEIINGQKVVFEPPHPQTWFRSFDTLDEGVAHHFVFLKTKRYKIAWTAVESGNPAAFAHLLKNGGYYTAPESDYVKGLNYFFNKFMKDNTFETIIQDLTGQEYNREDVIMSGETTNPTPPPIPDPFPTPAPDPLVPIIDTEDTVPMKSWTDTITNIFLMIRKFFINK